MDLTFDDLFDTVNHDSEDAIFEEPVISHPHGLATAIASDLAQSARATAAIQSSSIGGADIDWQASFDQAKVAAVGPAVLTEQNAAFSLIDQQGGDMEIEVAKQNDGTTLAPAVTAIDEFFIKNGASRPPFPCNHCRSRRLQCLILQTTAANPNPTTSCSSCVALFRECSLSGRAKRVPSTFETSMPVIGHLHGVNEQEGDLEPLQEGHTQLEGGASSVSALSSKRVNTRSVPKTRALRNWFANHLNHPYPSEEDKVALAKESGLSKSQVVNWFANNRRRHRLASRTHNHQSSKVFLSGSPMPQPLGMSPMERWRSSPPDEEPASSSAIENALSAYSSSEGLEDIDLSWLGGLGPSTSVDHTFSDNYSFTDASSGSASTCFSQQLSFESPILRSTDGSAHHPPSRPRSASSRKRSAASGAFQCTFCRRSYKKKYDWARHERSVHLPGLDSYICSNPLPPDQSPLIWRMNESNPRCIFCGHSSPDDEHINSHEFESCAERPISERRFTRKDHLWQHLHKFHGCRKWEGWKLDMGLLQDRQGVLRSRCGFCHETLNTWEERMGHLAAHFRSGLTMDCWVGDHGIDGIESGS